MVSLSRISKAPDIKASKKKSWKENAEMMSIVVSTRLGFYIIAFSFFLFSKLPIHYSMFLKYSLIDAAIRKQGQVSQES